MREKNGGFKWETRALMLPGIYNFSLLTREFDKLSVGGNALHMTLNSL